MPKATRQRITQRGQVEVNDKTGSSGVPAATRVSAMAPVTRNSHVSDNTRWAGSGFRALSGTFNEMANQLEQAERKAEIEAKIAQRESQAASKQAEKEEKARLDNVDITNGKLAGLSFARTLNEKADSEGWGFDDASEHFQAARDAVKDSPAWQKGFDTYAWKALEKFAVVDSANEQGQAQEIFNSQMRQGLDDLHNAYDPDTYYQSRQELFNSRDTYGVKGSWINTVEFESIENNALRFASSDPVKAQHLLELAEQKRPDDSPSLAASIPGGYTRLLKLREAVNNSIVRESRLADTELKQEHAETTKGNYLDAITTIAQMGDPKAIQKWETENLKGKSPSELEALYGDYRADVLSKVRDFQSNVKPAGNEQALTEHMMNIERGQAEWEDINQDNRISDYQRAQLYGKLSTITQQTQKGYLNDNQLAIKLLSDLEQSWPDSVYGTPWLGSRNMEPGKPPIVTPEGNFYQGELLKRLREAEPNLDVVESNAKKLGIVQDVHNEIISGRLKFDAYDGKINEPVPELKLSEKVKDGQRLSASDISSVAKTFNTGGAKQIRDSLGVDYFALHGDDQRRVAAEAQRQKAEVDVLQSRSLLNRTRKAFRDTLGLPEPQYDALEYERQMNEEAARLTLEGMELDKAIMLNSFKYEP